MVHAFLFPIPHKGLQISNFKRTFWKMEVDLLIEVLMHANINAIWSSPPHVRVVVLQKWPQSLTVHTGAEAV